MIIKCQISVNDGTKTCCVTCEDGKRKCSFDTGKTDIKTKNRVPTSTNTSNKRAPKPHIGAPSRSSRSSSTRPTPTPFHAITTDEADRISMPPPTHSEHASFVPHLASQTTASNATVSSFTNNPPLLQPSTRTTTTETPRQGMEPKDSSPIDYQSEHIARKCII